MKIHSVAVITIRVLALYTVVTAFGNLHFAGLVLGGLYNLSVAPVSRIIIGFAPFVFYVVSAGLLWRFAEAIAAKILVNTNTNEETIKADSTKIQAVFFSLLGMYVLTEAIPHLARLITMFSFASQSSSQRFSQQTIGEIVGLIVRLAIGSWLLLDSKGIVKIVQSMRGMKESPESRSQNPE